MAFARLDYLISPGNLIFVQAFFCFNVILLNDSGGVESLSIQQTQASSRTVHFIPHARTLRKAREQVKMMVADGASLYQIRNYLSRWLYWWLKTATI